MPLSPLRISENSVTEIPHRVRETKGGSGGTEARRYNEFFHGEFVLIEHPNLITLKNKLLTPQKSKRVRNA